MVLHPESADDRQQEKLAHALIDSIRRIGIPRTVIVYPNNDPGSAGIVGHWGSLAGASDIALHRNLPRCTFLGLLRDAAMLIGNSSSGIIEAGSFGTPVIDIGDRQSGRERGTNVAHVHQPGAAFDRLLRELWNKGNPIRFPSNNPYGKGGAADKITKTLALIDMGRFRKKLIAY